MNSNHKNILCFFLVWFSVLLSDTGNGWYWQNPLPQGNDLWDVWVFDSTTVVAVGNFGTIIKSNDGGQTWIFPSSGIINGIYGIHFANDNIGWASGGHGRMLKTTDGGNTWDSVETGTNYNLYDVFFINNEIGWAVGSGRTIMKTTDGGLNWSECDVGFGDALFSVYFVNEHTGWAAGGMGEIYKTIDGGETWITLESGVITLFKSVFFTSDSVGWVCGVVPDTVGSAPAFLETRDGGETWNVEIDPYLMEMYSVYFVDRDTGWVAGEWGVYKTTDGGDTWIGQDRADLCTAVHFVDGNTGWTVGIAGSMYKTTDGGENWIAQRKGAGVGGEIYFLDANLGYATGSGLAPTRGRVLRTTDGGTNWEKLSEFIDIRFSDIYFVNELLGFMPGHSFIDGVHGVVFRTVDGANSWETTSFPDICTSVYFSDDSTGWFVSWGGKIYKTTDSGIYWVQQESGIEDDPFNNLFSVFFIDSNIGYVGGDNIVLKTINGGYTWEQALDVYGTVYDVFFVNYSIGWAIGGGQGGLIFKTTDGANTWTQQVSGTNSWLKAVWFVDSNNGWSVGDNGIFLKTTNGGDTWSYEPTTTRDLDEIFFLNSDTGWVAGGGALLKTTTGGSPMEVIDNRHIVFTRETFALSQNYPNPFNSVTNIQYELPKTTHVRIGVYNILGEEIDVLVDKTQLLGSYGIFWDGRNESGKNVSSGIYIYKLITDDFVETKKMLLLR